MKIGELAKLTGFSVQTIRYYEKEKLLSPPRRNEVNYRLYSQNNLEQLTFIKQCRNLDITLSEIRHLMTLQQSPDDLCIEINQLIDNHIKQIDSRINELNSLKTSLGLLSTQCGKKSTIKDCGILKKLQS